MPWQRRIPRGRDVRRALNIADLREMARRRVPGFVFEYVEGGAEDEVTLRCNRESFERLRLIPRTLIDTHGRHSRIQLFGQESGAPLVIAPTGLNGMLHPRADVLLARAAARRKIPFCLSTLSTSRLEEVAIEAGGRLWMQLYFMKDRAIGEDIMRRAAAAGYEGLVFTTDANVFGSREWDQRSYRSPGHPTLRTALDSLRHPGWLRDLIRNGIPRFRNLEGFLTPSTTSAVGGSTIVPRMFAPGVSWDDISWIRERWPRKLLLKGILNVADAVRAADLGCEGIVISNHGGRQLDSCVTPLDMLPQIAAAVGSRMTTVVDSGFRRGTDIVKALALGANAVMLGRATLYGLAAAGPDGVERALEILTSEIDRVLGQLGCRSVAELGPDFIHRA